MTAVYAEPVSNSAYLCLQSNQDIAWRPVSAGVTPTVVSGNGTYQVTYQMQHDANLLVALVLSTDINAYSYAPSTAQASTILQDTSVRMTVQSITVTEPETKAVSSWTYTGPSQAAFGLNDDQTTLRLNIWNVWQEPAVQDLTNKSGSSGQSFRPDTALKAGDTITVTFTVTGMDNDSISEAERGDLDKDGAVTLADATLALTAYAEQSVSNPLPLTPEALNRADVDRDGILTLSDATYILTYYAECAVQNHPKWETIIGI